MFEEGPTEIAIIKALATALRFSLGRNQLVTSTGLSVDAVRSALYRMKKKGLVINLTRGVWSLRKFFRKVRHTIRIIETRQAQKIGHEWDCDAEATSEGLVWYPYPDDLPPNRPPQDFTEKVAHVLTPILKEAMLDILAKTDPPVLLRSSAVDVEPRCARIHIVRPPKFCILGTEWLDEVAVSHDPVHEVEVAFMGSTGQWYNLYGSMQVEEDAI